MATPRSRRAVLAGVGGLALVGLLPACTGDGGAAPTPTRSTAPPPPDPLLALLAVREALVTSADAVVGAHPQLAGRVGPVRDQVQEHVAALRRALALPATTSATTSASGTATETSSSSAVPPDPAVALAGLRTAVLAAGEGAGTACLTAPRERAPLLGSLAAAGAAHGLVLA